MRFSDKSVLAGTSRRESDGALIADVRIARTGVQHYLGREVDPDGSHGHRPQDVVAVYRPGDEVFSKDTMASAAHRPVTNDHPPGNLIDSSNWKEHAVGNTTDEIRGEGIFLRVPLMVSDGAAIADIESGKRQVSTGYTSELDWTAGTSPTGDSYDAVQRNIRINHVAIVSRGRAGSEVRIGDEAAWVDNQDTEGEPTMDKTRQVTVDGITIEVTDQGAQVISKLQQQLADANTASAKVLADHATALATKDKEIATRDAQIDDLKKKVLDAAGIDKLVVARTDLLVKARLVAKDAKFEGLSDADIRKTAVAAALGDESIKDRAPAYIDARFDILVEDASKNVDTFRQVVQTGIVPAQGGDKVVADSYAAMLAEMANGGKPVAKAN